MKVTSLEIKAIETFKNESIDCCGDFDEEGSNMSYMNATDLASALSISKHAASGLIGSLESKGLICDTGESPRGDSCNDYVGNAGLINEILGE